MPPVTHSMLLRYGAAVLISALALLIELLIPLSPVPLFFIAVILSSWYGGLGPGLLATFFGALATTYFFLPPTYSLGITGLDSAIRLIAFVLAALLISWLNAARSSAERRYRDLVQGLDAIVWEADPKLLRFSFVSQSAVAILGYSVEQWRTEPNFWANHLHPNDREQTIALYRRAVSEGKDYELEYRMLTIDGRVVWLHDRVYVVRDLKSRPQQLRGLMVDITKPKQAEEALRESNERIQLLAETASHLLLMDKPQEFINSLYKKLSLHLNLEIYLNYLVSEDGRTLRLDSYHGVSDQFAKGIERLELDPITYECLTLKPDRVILENIQPLADLRTVLVRSLGITAYVCYPLRAYNRFIGILSFGTRRRTRFDPDELALMQTVCDQVAMAMERIRLISELQWRAEELVEAHRRKDEFLATLAHELRNPLAPILSALQLMHQRGVDDPDLRRSIDVMERQTQHMVQLVDDLLDVSRITRGKVWLRKEPLDLATVIAQGVEASRPFIETYKHELSVSLPQEPVWLEADPVRMEQVLVNLLSNAAKYTDPGGRIWLIGAQEGEEVVLRVRDTGIGIPPEMLSRVFDLFTQLDRSLDRAQGGLGIGLTLVQRLVEMHGGRVSAYSAGPGQGSEFIVRLPALSRTQGYTEVAMQGCEGIAMEKDSPHSRVAASWRPRIVSSSPRRVLIVDDNVDAATTLGELLKLWGHEVQVVYDGPSAIAEALVYQPEVVLLDIGLPEMDGYQVARQLQQESKLSRMVLVALTGYSQEEDQCRSREAGFDYHFTKPVDLFALQRMLSTEICK